MQTVYLGGRRCVLHGASFSADAPFRIFDTGFEVWAPGIEVNSMTAGHRFMAFNHTRTDAPRILPNGQDTARVPHTSKTERIAQ